MGTLEASAGWQVVGFLGELQGVPVTADLPDGQVVVFRTGAGELGAFRNKCPHVGFSMATGESTEAGLKCAHHGFEFGINGVCLSVPRGDPKRAAAATTFEVANLEQLVFVKSVEAKPTQQEIETVTELQRQAVPIAELTRFLESVGKVSWGRIHCEDTGDHSHLEAGAHKALTSQELAHQNQASDQSLESLESLLAESEAKKTGRMIEMPGLEYPMFAGGLWNLYLEQSDLAIQLVMPAVGGKPVLILMLEVPALSNSAHHSHLYVTCGLTDLPAAATRLDAALAEQFQATKWADTLHD